MHSSYDGSNVVFRLLRLETWGPALMNLGFFNFFGPLAFLNVGVNLELAQRRLVLRSLALLEVGRRHKILDVACGRGKSSFIAQSLFPEANVIGNEYEAAADESGFHLLSKSDWSHRVTHPIQWLFRCHSTLGNTRWGRRVLRRKNPLYQSISIPDWKESASAVSAHDHVHRHSKYMAFVFAKR